MSKDYEAALRIMRKAHKDQYRKDGKTTYEEHPLEVARLLKEEGYPERVQIAGLLHDVIEDGPNDQMWMNTIEQVVGREVLEIVMWVTDVDGPGLRGVRKWWSAQKLARAPRYAQVVKLADRLANMQDAHGLPVEFRKIYLAETQRLVNLISQANYGFGDKIMDIVWRLEMEMEE